MIDQQVIRIPGDPSVIRVIERGPPGPPGPGGGLSSTVNFVALNALGGHRAVKAVAGGVDYASASVKADAGLLVGISVAAASTGQTIAVAASGLIEETSWNWSLGPVYLGANGVLTQSTSSFAFLQQVGIAVSATKIIVDIGLPIIRVS